ncbi:PepSY domain-containing protein [Streptomyces globisporus]|uniref:PepSY-associated TM helix domain-containing protein n=1 Tax=Streptomyces globisporus TaxID=1908 RepID=UPI000AB42B22|nr:PepSY domain-containing protein [Streptomyces globisporus]
MSATIGQAPQRTAPAGTAPAGRSWQGVRALLVRLHFYAGVFVAPFLLVAALTGLVYTFTPQLDQLVHGDQLRVQRVGDRPRPLSEQIAAARAAHPEGGLASVITPAEPEDTTRVVLSVPDLGEKQRTVFVDPYTAKARGDLTTSWGSTPLTTWLDELHRSPHLGETGRLYAEVAASWLWVLVVGGLVLWLGRGRGRRAKSVRGALLPDRAARGVRRTRSFHAVTGVWLALGLLFLSATGLTWSTYAGERFGQLLDAAKGHAPELDTLIRRPPDAKGASRVSSPCRKLSKGSAGRGGRPSFSGSMALQSAMRITAVPTPAGSSAPLSGRKPYGADSATGQRVKPSEARTSRTGCRTTTQEVCGTPAHTARGWPRDILRRDRVEGPAPGPEATGTTAGVSVR